MMGYHGARPSRVTSSNVTPLQREVHRAGPSTTDGLRSIPRDAPVAVDQPIVASTPRRAIEAGRRSISGPLFD